MRKKIIISFLLCIIFQIVYAQNKNAHYYFNHYDINEGLSQNSVNTILQDKTGFIWIGTKDGLNRFDGFSFRIYRREINNKNSIGNNFIKTLFEDTDGNIWIGTDAGLYIYDPIMDSFSHFDKVSEDGIIIRKAVSAIESFGDSIWIAVEEQGVFCFDKSRGVLTNYNLDKWKISSNIECIRIDKNNTVWLGSYGDGLYYSKDNLETIHEFQDYNKEKPFKGDVITEIVIGAYNCLYVGSIRGGLKELNLGSGKVRNLLSVDDKRDNIYIRKVLINADHELWLGTESGIYIYNLTTNKYQHITSSLYDEYALSDNAIYALYKDKEGGIWIGSYFGGLNYYPKQYTYFEKYYPNNTINSIRGKRVREFYEDPDGTIWVGTEDGGLSNFDPSTRKVVFFEPSKDFTNIQAVFADADYLWIGTFSKGLKIINKNTGKIKTYTQESPQSLLTDNSIFSICKTSDGMIYIGTLFGLLKYDVDTDDFTKIKELEGKFVYNIKEDTSGNLWLGTYANGVYRYDINTKKWKNYLYDKNDSTSLSYNKVTSIFEDSRRRIWVTTQGGGFCQYDAENDFFKRYNSENGYQNDVIYKIVEDNSGSFWITTNDGLMCFDPQSGNFKMYTSADGILGDQFNYMSGIKSTNGDIYLGSIEGFIKFNPKDFSENEFVPTPVITDFLLYNKQIKINENNSPLKKSITFSDQVVLKHNQNSFTFRVAALGFLSPQTNTLLYRLENFDDEWQTVGESPLITYSNLKHGKYKFRLKASNGSNMWNEDEKSIELEILPPFYLSIWAFILYFVVAALIILYVVYYMRRKSSIKEYRAKEKFRQEKEREIYNAKIDFFTNVAHEVRTPLALIKGPLDNILLKSDIDSSIKEDLNIMSSNTDRLLNLVNQLLDFRKVEVENYKLNFIKCNISNILKGCYSDFKPLLLHKKIDFQLHLSEQDFFAHVNEEAFMKIISNLFNNAIKYSDTYIKAELFIGEESFTVRVENDGYIIPADMRKYVFEPFTRINKTISKATGTGIGLALSRSLAELHQGTLDMEDDFNLNVFSLNLPKTHIDTILLASDSDDNTTLEIGGNIENENSESYKHTILVVEDDPEMLLFIAKQLSIYTVYTANDGLEALNVMKDKMIDLIVSDVMMPNLNGFELCEKVKSDIDYSHIPVILLTAKTNIQSKIEGLEMGADLYIEKPFSVEYLNACVGNLIRNREKLRESFANSPFIATNSVALTKTDEIFLKNLNEIFHSNIENPDFSIDEVAVSLNMSRSSFYRKINGVLNMSPSEYLRLVRLKKAAELLVEGENRINEVCYLVGFSSPSYFTKCFQKQFGVLPKDFVNEQTKSHK